MTVHKNEVYYADLDPVIGSEQGGIRPVLVIQNDTFVSVRTRTINRTPSPHSISTTKSCWKKASAKNWLIFTQKCKHEI